jgi:hypothetical protein
MRVARVRLQRFRGFERAEFTFPGSVVLAGEPRAGRTDLVEGLRRVLDPRSTATRVDPLDVHRPLTQPQEPTEVEVTLLDLGPELRDIFDAYLEPFDARTGALATGATGEEIELGIRLCYRARYDFETDTGDHWVDSPALSDPDNDYYSRVSRADREAIPVRFLSAHPPLQVRAEGQFRRLLEEMDSDKLSSALTELEFEMDSATDTFTHSEVVAGGLRSILEAGPSELIGLDNPDDVHLVTDDGSLATLLRTLQPALTLDAAGALPLRTHGSSAYSIMAASEAVAVVKRGTGIVVVADDFGDTMDSPSAEHLAHLLGRAADQVVITTRRAEVIRAFDSSELVRLTRSGGPRESHRLAPTDKHGRFSRQLVLDGLISAVSCETVILVEGPLDADGYGTLARRLAQAKKDPVTLVSNKAKLLSPPGSDGGKTRLAAMAAVARQLGFKVRAVVDNDKNDDGSLTRIEEASEAVIVLPPRYAVEAALVRGLPTAAVRTAVDQLVSSGEIGEQPDVADERLADLLVEHLLKKQRLHGPWALALGRRPPVATEVVRAAFGDHVGRIQISEPE